MARGPVIVRFGNDLRLGDHAALRAAVAAGAPVVPVYLWSPEAAGHGSPGAAGRVFLHHCLASLGRDLADKGSRLVLRRTDDPAATLAALCERTGASAVYWNRRFEPDLHRLDAKVRQALVKAGIEVRDFAGQLLYEPHEVATRAGDPYRVYTPFYRATEQLPEPEGPRPAPSKGQFAAPPNWPDGESLDDLGLLPDHPWAEKVIGQWPVGERPARDRLRRFCREGIFTYDAMRDRPDLDGTSQLSPHLHWGTISPRQAWAAALDARAHARTADARKGCDTFLRELVWREFSYHVLHHFPHTPTQPLHEKFNAMPWSTDRDMLAAWQRGRTGFPLVDAGMRQLWETGWMHNRVRMVVASFLTKDLRIGWLEGARWFWDTLVDADLANNTMGWQWAAGCGADAQPFFRIFNPTTQGKKFDPEGRYIRRWCPELADLPDKHVHEPHKAGGDVDYPAPVVDHAEARAAALEAFEQVKA